MAASISLNLASASAAVVYLSASFSHGRRLFKKSEGMKGGFFGVLRGGSVSSSCAEALDGIVGASDHFSPREPVMDLELGVGGADG